MTDRVIGNHRMVGEVFRCTSGMLACGTDNNMANVQGMHQWQAMPSTDQASKELTTTTMLKKQDHH